MTDDEKLGPEKQPNKRKRNKPRRRGAGSVFRRPDRKGKQWVAQLALENGKTKQRSVTPEAEADEALNERLSEQQHGTLLPEKNLTVKQQRERWIENVHTQTIDLSTSSADRRNSENHILPERRHGKLQQRTVRRGEAFDTKKVEEGVCASSIKRLHFILSQVRDHAVRSTLLARNGCGMARKALLRQARHARHALDQKQAQQLVATAKGRRLEAFCILAIVSPSLVEMLKQHHIRQ